MRRVPVLLFIVCTVLGLMSAAAVSGIPNLYDRVLNIKSYYHILPIVYADYCPEGVVLPGVCDPLPSQNGDPADQCAQDPNCGPQQAHQPRVDHYKVCYKYSKNDRHCGKSYSVTSPNGTIHVYHVKIIKMYR
jgi:hypothetical protein